MDKVEVIIKSLEDLNVEDLGELKFAIDVMIGVKKGEKKANKKMIGAC